MKEKTLLLMKRVPWAAVLILVSVLPILVLDFRPSGAALIPDALTSGTDIETASLPEATEPIVEAPQLEEETGPITVSRTLHIGRGDTLMKLLTKAGVDRRDAHNAIEALRDHFDPRRLRLDHQVVVDFEYPRDDPDAQSFAALTIRPDRLHAVVVSRVDDGFKAQKTKKEVNRGLVRADGVIKSSLYVAATKAGVPPAVLVELVRIYSWDLDFQRSIQPEDRFEVMYERYVTEDGKAVRYGDILYANLVLQGEPHMLYRYQSKDGNFVDYYDENGKGARKALMRTPINGARLSSGYGVRRHPILGFNKMHRGVDFAAPKGTPVYAAGNGTIVYRGRNGGYGNYVRIRHNAEFSTAYAHLNGFSAKARKGARVKQGDVIGYVGSTGRSTGAHLHYEILRRGRQVNPMRVKMPSSETLAGAEMKRFQSARVQIDAQLAALPHSTQVAESN